MKAYKVQLVQKALQPFQQTSQPTSPHPGAILSLSANGSRNGTGILWAVQQDVADMCPSQRPCTPNPFTTPEPGIIRAYDAENLSRELWDSGTTRHSDPLCDPSSVACPLGTFAKFTPVTVANGKVYAPTFSGKLVVYGLLP